MAVKYKTKAFVFKKSDINEADRVFSVFSDEFGRLDVSAKAIRKIDSKLKSGIDTFSLSEIEFIQGKNKKTLTDALMLEKFSNVLGNRSKFAAFSRMGEVLDSFIKGEEKDSKIFDFLKDIFAKLNDQNLSSSKCAILYYYFLWNILSLLGYKPEADKCNECGAKLNPYNIYFSSKFGGVVCKTCKNKDLNAHKANSDIVKILRLILKKDWQILSKLKIEPASYDLFKKISDSYYLYVLPSH